MSFCSLVAYEDSTAAVVQSACGRSVLSILASRKLREGCPECEGQLDMYCAAGCEGLPDPRLRASQCKTLPDTRQMAECESLDDTRAPPRKQTVDTNPFCPDPLCTCRSPAPVHHATILYQGLLSSCHLDRAASLDLARRTLNLQQYGLRTSKKLLLVCPKQRALPLHTDVSQLALQEYQSSENESPACFRWLLGES